MCSRLSGLKERALSDTLLRIFDESAAVIPDIRCITCETPMRLAVIEPLLDVEGVDRFVYECACGFVYRHPVARA